MGRAATVRRRLVAGLVLGALLLAACGSGDDDDSAPSSTSAAPTSAAPGSTSTVADASPGSLRAKELCESLSASTRPRPEDVAGEATFQGKRVVFAGKALTGGFLSADDAFRRQLSALDRQILAVSDEPVDEAAVDAELRASGVDWTAEEIAQLTAALGEAERAANDAGVDFDVPDPIHLAKASPELYSGAPHTRCATVFLPAPIPASILLHELWHIMSRYHPEARDDVYALVGYRPCDVDLSGLGPDLRDVVITNPDTEAFGESCITLDDAGKPTVYAPLLIGQGSYDGTADGWAEILRPVLVEVRGGQPVVSGGVTSHRDLVADDYMAAVGGNGEFEPFHPEELVAVNLEYALLPEGELATFFPNAQLVEAVKAKVAAL